MIEKAVKGFWLVSTVCLTLSYVLAWFRDQSATFFPNSNPIEFHFLIAIPSSLFHFFSALMVLFYFIGTGKWIKDEAMSLARVDRARAEAVYEVFKKANKLKGRAFPFVTFAIFFGIMTFVMGGARHVEAIPLWIHPALGSVLVLISLASFPFIFPAIDANVRFLDEASTLIDADN